MARICVDCGHSSTSVKWNKTGASGPVGRRCSACYSRRQSADPKRGVVRRAYTNTRRAAARQLMAWGHRLGCVDCGAQLPPVVMQYDHVDPETKRADVSAMKGYPLAAIVLEISRCESVCPLCHAFRTDMERLISARGGVKLGQRLRVLQEAVVG